MQILLFTFTGKITYKKILNIKQELNSNLHKIKMFHIKSKQISLIVINHFHLLNLTMFYTFKICLSLKINDLFITKKKRKI